MAELEEIVCDTQFVQIAKSAVPGYGDWYFWKHMTNSETLAGKIYEQAIFAICKYLTYIAVLGFAYEMVKN